MFFFNKIFSLSSASSALGDTSKSNLSKTKLYTGFIDTQHMTPDTIQFDTPDTNPGFTPSHPLRAVIIDEIYSHGVLCGYFPESQPAKKQIISKISSSYFVDLAINSIPDIQDLTKLKTMAKWIFILFKFDDIIDEKKSIFQDKSVEDRIKLASTFATECYRILATGNNNPTCYLELSARISTYNREEWDNIQKLFLSLKDLYSDLLFLCGNNQAEVQRKSEQFRTQVNQYFQSAVTELKTVDTVDHATYIEHRKKSGAVPTAFALSLQLYDIEVPEAIINSDGYQAMLYHSNLAICLVNDGVSAGKEWDSPEPNYLKIRFSDHLRDGHSPKEAFRKAKEDLERLHDKNIEGYIDGISTLERQLNLKQLHINDLKLLSLDASEEAFKDTKSEIYLLYKTYSDTIAKIRNAVDYWISSNFYYSDKTERYKVSTPIPS